MSAAYRPRAYSANSTPRQAGDTPRKASRRAKSSHPVQLTIFDYAASIGVTLLPEAS